MVSLIFQPDDAYLILWPVPLALLLLLVGGVLDCAEARALI